MRATRSCAIVGLLSAWVLWKHVEGTLDRKPESFWHLLEPFETRAECLKKASFEVDMSVGEAPPGSLAALMHDARMKMVGAPKTERSGDGYREQFPDGRGFLRHSLQCWPAGTDPRPRIGEPR